MSSEPAMIDPVAGNLHGSPRSIREDRRPIGCLVEVGLLVMLFFVYAGDPPPMVNESHYLVKAKNYWQPDWCASDMLASSAKAHVTFYAVFGWLTQLFSLSTTAWIGRFVGWTMLAFGLQQLCRSLFQRPYASLAVATVWIAGIEYGNLAGEWVVGGIEAKVPAYGFVLLGLSEMVRRRWNRVWPLLGLASAFHVLTGGWSVVAAAFAWWITERGQPDRRPLLTPWLFVGGAIALFGLLPAVALTLRAGSEDSATAARIYTYYRLRHHLLPADFAASWYLRHAVLLLATFVAAYQFRGDAKMVRAGAFTLGAVLIAATGFLLGYLPSYDPDLAARLLRYYWFRLSDAAVPLMLGLCIAGMLLDHRSTTFRVGLAGLALAVTLVSTSAYQSARLKIPPTVSNDLLGYDAGAPVDRQQQVYRDWLAVCRWARLSSPSDEVFLTPRHQQTFKWYAERGEVVNWKDVPQDAKSLLEWHRRFQEIFPRRLGHIRVTIRYDDLRQFRRRYGARWMIVDQRICGDRLPLVRLYPVAGERNDTFAVYELPEL